MHATLAADGAAADDRRAVMGAGASGDGGDGDRDYGDVDDAGGIGGDYIDDDDDSHATITKHTATTNDYGWS